MCTNQNKLLIVALALTIKSDHGLSEAGYDRIIERVRNILLEENWHFIWESPYPLNKIFYGYQP